MKSDVQLLEDYQRTRMLPVSKKHKITKRELRVREFILEMQATCTNIQIAKRATEKMGTTVSYAYVQRVKKDMDEEAREEFRSITSFEAGLEARQEYKQLKDLGLRLLFEAELIEDPERRVDAQRKALAEVRNSREAEDRMYKMMGIHKEQLIVGHLQVTELEEWKNIKQAFLVYLTTVLTCPECEFKGFDPTGFFDFMDKSARDPHYVDQFMSRTAQDNYAHGKYGDEARELLQEAEFEEHGEG